MNSLINYYLFYMEATDKPNWIKYIALTISIASIGIFYFFNILSFKTNINSKIFQSKIANKQSSLIVFFAVVAAVIRKIKKN